LHLTSASLSGDAYFWRRLVPVTPYLGDAIWATPYLGGASSLTAPCLGDALSWRRLILAMPHLWGHLIFVFVSLIFDL